MALRWCWFFLLFNHRSAESREGRLLIAEVKPPRGRTNCRPGNYKNIKDIDILFAQLFYPARFTSVKITIAVPLKCNLFAQLAHFMAIHAPCTLVLAVPTQLRTGDANGSYFLAGPCLWWYINAPSKRCHKPKPLDATPATRLRCFGGRGSIEIAALGIHMPNIY